MSLWAEFWGAWLVVAGLTFAGITVIVAWKGLTDLRAMFRDLTTNTVNADKGATDRGRSQ